MTTRRQFLSTAASIAAGCTIASLAPKRIWAEDKEPLFKISLAQWSFHKELFAKKLDNLDFAKRANELGIQGVEYVNQFFKDKAKDSAYIAEMKKRASDNNVTSVLIMCDGEGNLGDPDAQKRKTAVENHYKWVEAAKELGCHSIRVNAASSGTYEEQQKLASEGLRALSEFAASAGLNVIVENHGHLSSNGAWLAGTIKMVDLKNCGTLPDFGNFNLGDGKTYDRYVGVAEMMPYAKAVSAKSHDFDDKGNETHTDYFKMMKIVLDAGYHGYVGIEYEGNKVSEIEGVKLTKTLLERVRAEMSKA